MIGMQQQPLAVDLDERPVVAPCGGHVLEELEAAAVPFEDARAGVAKARTLGVRHALGEREEVPAVDDEVPPLLRRHALDALERREATVAELVDRRRQRQLVRAAAA